MIAIARWLGVGLLLLSGTQSAWAQLYSRDSDLGVNTIVVDVQTDLSWLQLSSSTGLTSADWQGADENGWTFQSGAYEGYRVATQSEISALVMSYVVCPDGPGSCGTFSWSDVRTTQPDVVSRALEVIELFGGDVTTSSDGSPRGVMSGAVIYNSYPSWNTALWAHYDSTGTPTIGSDRYSSRNGMTYLIAPVPEPSTYALMLAGLAAVAFVARRRKSLGSTT